MKAIAVDSISAGLLQAADRACGRIAPTWPLDRAIAVNPWWGLRERPIEQAAATLAGLCGARLLAPRSFLRAEWQARRLRTEHLQAVLAQPGGAASAAEAQALLAALVDRLQGKAATAADPELPRWPLVTTLLGETRVRGQAQPWRDLVTHQISQHCAAFFDAGQALWQPDRSAGLYASWREQLALAQGLPLRAGQRAFARRVLALPAEPLPALALAVAALELPADAAVLEAHFTAALFSINGWAAWCAHERWQARLAQTPAADAGSGADHLLQLLAIRLCWDALLLHDAGLQAPWRAACSAGALDPLALQRQHQQAQRLDWLAQAALEWAWQAPLCQALAGQGGSVPAVQPALQAVFCIDVRSEVFRRALEARSPAISSHGCAGFFGLPAAYEPLGTPVQRPQLPGLLAPVRQVHDRADGGASLGLILARARQQRLQGGARWQALRSSAASGFSFVEALGLGYVARLLRASLPQRQPAERMHDAGLTAADAAALRPVLVPAADAEDDVALAAGILAATGLAAAAERLAPLVLLAGHGSQSANNPHAAGLDCGACGGQTGEINARVVAALLNDAGIRAGLRHRGIALNPATHFVAGLHNTATDALLLFDTETVPATHRRALAQLQRWLAEAGDAARAERAPGLDGAAAAPAASAPARLAALQQRACDWAQLRPEWGLANNAGFIVAPRARTRALNLAGRCFLHDYDHRHDADGAWLELIMTAPMVVTNWINLQYHASSVDPQLQGSGNKLLHNVVGGCIGVFEGNGGDLRIGLPWQSVHDGRTLRHTPLRLSVFIEAPRAAIDRVLAAHETVRDLVGNGWLHLFRIEPGGAAIERHGRAGWQALATAAAVAVTA